MSRYQETLNLIELTRSLGDGHTAIVPQGRLERYTRLFEDNIVKDISFSYESDKIYVTIGSQSYPLIGLNGHKTDEILKNCQKYDEHENVYAVKKVIGAMNKQKTLVLLDLAQTTDNSMTIQYLADKTLKEQIFPYSVRSKKETKDWEYCINEKEQYAILTINQCKNTPDFSAFLNRFLAEIKEADIQYIAIDLRSNNGGNDICDLMISCLGEKQYSTSQSLPDKPLGKIENKISMTWSNTNAFRGKVYVLTSRKTYSSAKVLAVTLSMNGLAEIIGEPSSNSPSSYGNCKIEYLSDRDYLLQISQDYVYFPVEGDTMRVDVPCSPEEAVDVFKKEIHAEN